MKALIEHGIRVLTKRCNDKLFIEIVARGKLIYEDYQLFIPIVEKLSKLPKVSR